MQAAVDLLDAKSAMYKNMANELERAMTESDGQLLSLTPHVRCPYTRRGKANGRSDESIPIGGELTEEQQIQNLTHDKAYRAVTLSRIIGIKEEKVKEIVASNPVFSVNKNGWITAEEKASV